MAVINAWMMHKMMAWCWSWVMPSPQKSARNAKNLLPPYCQTSAYCVCLVINNGDRQMHATKIKELTRGHEAMAIINGSYTEDCVTAYRVDLRRKAGEAVSRYRITWAINGNRCTRKDAAKRIENS
jgi:hypothetical protein